MPEKTCADWQKLLHNLQKEKEMVRTDIGWHHPMAGLPFMPNFLPLSHLAEELVLEQEKRLGWWSQKPGRIDRTFKQSWEKGIPPGWPGFVASMESEAG